MLKVQVAPKPLLSKAVGSTTIGWCTKSFWFRFLQKAEKAKKNKNKLKETSDILKQVRKIEIKTRGLSNDIFAGHYHSAFRGRGVSFSEVREYRVGDDVRDIDWNVTARMRKPHIKIYEEERELTMMLMVDVSGSGAFGSGDKTKRAVMTEIAAVLAFSAAQNNDKVGCLLFSDRVEKFIPPKKGRSHILRIISTLLEFEPESKATSLVVPLEYLTAVLKKRSTTFVLSDFDTPASEDERLSKVLGIASGKHDIVGIKVYDPRDAELPDVGLVEMEDLESGRRMFVDTSSRAAREHYAAQWNARHEAMDKILARVRVDHADVTTEEDYVKELIKLFKRR
ncbi:MAG: DUF58 domain-containing protein [Tidjanibacter sp.]|nr:DUF58 domain-containing protein [Tidjanibacter sp.]